MAFLGYLKQSTAATLLLGPFLDDADGKTAETALTISQADVLLWKQGGTTLAQKNESTSCTHRSNGLYTCPVDTTDTNTLGILSVSVAESGALPIRHDYAVVAASVWDELHDTVGPVPHLGIIDRGTAQAATGTTLQLRSAAVFADDTIIGATVMAFGSTQGYWQQRVVTDYVLSTDTATVDTWTVTPSGTITYVVLASAPGSTTLPFPVDAVKVGGQTASAAGTVTFPGTIASTTNITAAAGCAVSSIGSGVITATSIASDALTAAKIASDVTTELQSGLATASALSTVSGKIDTIDDFLDTEIAAIKAKTDSLTFTQAGHVDANIQRINDVAITGDGSGTPFDV